MNADFYAALWGLLFAALGGLTWLVRLVGLRLQAEVEKATAAAVAAEANSNGKLSELMAENIRLRLEIEQLYAIIHSCEE